MNADNAESNPALKAFVDYYTGDAGYQAVADAGYVQMPEEDFATAISRLGGRRRHAGRARGGRLR